MGVSSSVKPEGWLDHAARVFPLAGVSIPNFLATVLMTLFLVRAFGWLPPLGYEEPWDDPVTD